jgi:hypothetical protein
MAKDVTEQLIELSTLLNKREEISTVLGAVNEIQFLRDNCNLWKKVASALYQDLIENSDFNFESSRIYEQSLKDSN